MQKEKNKHFAIERAIECIKQVYIHLIIPTQFGIHADDECGICSNQYTTKKKKIQQVFVRVIAGTETTELDAPWIYSLHFGTYCNQCKPLKQKNVFVVIDSSHFPQMVQLIDECAFQNHIVSPKNFLDETGANGFEALVESYLWRFTLLNSYIGRFCALLQRTANACHYCHEEKHSVQPCSDCHQFKFCAALDCKRKRDKYHCSRGPCQALKQQRLFHADSGDCIYFIERNARGACLKYKNGK